MRILFVSRLKYLPQAGPTYSVPNQVLSLSKLEDVLWVNIEQSPCEEWKQLQIYIGADDNIRLQDLPKGFEVPDLVVYQCLYHLRPCRVIAEVRQREIPYVIVPRSALTASAQLKSRLKKNLGNALFYKNFVRNASAIQYLSECERKDSGAVWNSRGIVIPNGIPYQHEIKQHFRDDKRHISFIGRYEPYQKGLDILIKAVKLVEDELRTYKVKINLHGSDRASAAERIHAWIMKAGIDDIVKLEGPAFGDVKQVVLLDSDAFIMTSRYEGMPMGLLEALSYGLPCIVTPGTNMSAEIESANAGWTCECTAESIANALTAFAKATDLPERSVNATQLASQYEWSEIAKRTAYMYHELLKAR